MKDDDKSVGDLSDINLDFYSQDLSDVIISIYTFLRRLTLTNDLPVLFRDRLREEKGEEHLRKIEER